MAPGPPIRLTSSPEWEKRGRPFQGSIMEAEIHPAYQACTVSCACGNSFQTRSVKKEIRTEICNACHPFFTGKQKMLDTAGRVERFMKRYKMEA